MRIWLILLAVTASGCISVPRQRLPVRERTGPGQGRSLERARALLPMATNNASLARTIHAFEKVIETDPANREALDTLCNLYILKGAAYETRTGRKRKAYRKALAYGEASMMTSPAFARKSESGAPVWEAAEVLTSEHIEAIAFWATALFYQFDECLPKVAKPFNLRWIRRAEKMLQTAYALDPDWGGGQLHFSYGIYYLMPAVVGGDMAKSRSCFDRAVATGPNWMINRWGRAKYYCRCNGDRDLFVKDLEWVIRHEPSESDGPRFWNVYCRRDARKLLSRVDRYFRPPAE